MKLKHELNTECVVAYLRQNICFEQFKRQPKTYMFTS